MKGKTPFSPIFVLNRNAVVTVNFSLRKGAENIEQCSRGDYSSYTRTPPVEAHRPVVTYLQFPIQVCFSVDHAQPATPTVINNFRHRQPYGLNSSIDVDIMAGQINSDREQHATFVKELLRQASADVLFSVLAVL